ncbi:hypothetical protein HAV15_009615 [Penicillium sp. str. |nr:hypothetical protein HAV15_009615 [Penicillium sp. str. \
MPHSASCVDNTFQTGFLRSCDSTPSHAPTPGFFSPAWAPSTGCRSPDPEQVADKDLSPLRHIQPDRVGLEEAVEHERGTSGEQPSDYIQYLIEWRVTLNRRVIVKDTEQDLVQMPSLHWPQIQARAYEILREKISRDRRIRPDDTTIVVSVNDRSQRDLTKRFDSTDMDWTAIEKQLLTWASLYRQGKELRLKVSVNYIEDSTPLMRTDKRGRTSVTKRMLADRDAQLDAEGASGQPSVWREVYQMMRCPGPPCRHDGQYCWKDPVEKRHYKLRTHQLRSLVKFVEGGGVLETHNDIPDSLREQLFAEDHERTTRQKIQAKAPLGSMCPPINITVLPNQELQPAVTGVTGPNYSPSTPSMAPTSDPIDIPGLHDVAVEEYSNWQQSRVSRDILKDDIRKARDLALANGLDLQQIHSDQDPDFFIKQGISMGVARRFVSEITQWAKLCATSVLEL